MEVWGQGENPVFRITKKPPSENGVNTKWTDTHFCTEKGRFYGQVVFWPVRGKADFTDRFPYVRRKILGHMLRFVKS